MVKSINFSDIDEIKKDIKKFSDLAVSEMIKEANKDMVDAHNQIIRKFYNSYKPKSYHRHGNGGLYKSLLKKEIRLMTSKNSGMATIKVGNQDMDEHYGTTNQRNAGKINSANILDLMWFKGVRGLPKIGINPLAQSYDWYSPHGGYMHWNAGDKWYNQFWSGENEPYKNIFLTRIEMNGYTSPRKLTANRVMEQFINDWGEFKGEEIADKIWKSI